YDSLFSIICNLWMDNVNSRTLQLRGLSVEMMVLVDGFSQAFRSRSTLEHGRDVVRRMLHTRSPEYFPYGHTNASVERLVDHIFPGDSCGDAITSCTRCGFRIEGSVQTFGHHVVVIPPILMRREPDAVVTMGKWFQNHLSCIVLYSHLVRQTTLMSVPDVLCLSITSKQVQLDPVLRFNCNGRTVVTKLRGIIYHGDEHFTSRIFSADGDIWFHDGITTRSSTRFEVNLKNDNLTSFHTYRRKDATLAVSV
ncbi:hypothetical protein C8J57DRAFT_1095413, partial [Mycena rebaudengoi]